MKTLGNVLWLIFGGLELAIGYLLAAVVCFALVVTIPFGFQAVKLAGYTLWPFGKRLAAVEPSSKGSAIGNVLWVVIFGVWLALGHVLAAALLALTVVGIPLAAGHVKLAGAALAPFGKQVVPA